MTVLRVVRHGPSRLVAIGRQDHLDAAGQWHDLN
jgi:hypothetical protein